MRLLYFPVLLTALVCVGHFCGEQLDADIVTDIVSWNEESMTASLSAGLLNDAEVSQPNWLGDEKYASRNLEMFAPPKEEPTSQKSRVAVEESWTANGGSALALFNMNFDFESSVESTSMSDAIAIYQIKDSNTKGDERARKASGVFGVGAAAKDWYRIEKIVVR